MLQYFYIIWLLALSFVLDSINKGFRNLLSYGGYLAVQFADLCHVLSKTNLRSLDFVINRFFMKLFSFLKLFKTNNTDAVKQCQQFFYTLKYPIWQLPTEPQNSRLYFMWILDETVNKIRVNTLKYVDGSRKSIILHCINLHLSIYHIFTVTYTQLGFCSIDS